MNSEKQIKSEIYKKMNEERNHIISQKKTKKEIYTEGQFGKIRSFEYKSDALQTNRDPVCNKEKLGSDVKSSMENLSDERIKRTFTSAFRLVDTILQTKQKENRDNDETTEKKKNHNIRTMLKKKGVIE